MTGNEGLTGGSIPENDTSVAAQSPATVSACVQGHPMPEDARFCTQCGAARMQFTGTQNSPPAPPPAPPQAPPQAAPPAAQPRTYGLAIAGLVCVILFGFVSRSKIKNSDGEFKGMGLAIADIIIGFAWVAAFIVLIVALAVSSSAGSGPSPESLQAKILSNWNSQNPSNPGASVQCAYDPSRWTEGYTFNCFIYKSNNTEVGTAAITSTSSGTTAYDTWNENLIPN